LHGVLCRKCNRPTGKISKLNEISQPPFAVFFKTTSIFYFHRALFEKEGDLLSQPIKGTAKRFSDAVEDEKQKLNWHRIQKRKHYDYRFSS
jgi:para-aminobenzoate synthetase component 1